MAQNTKIFWYTKMFTGPEMMTGGRKKKKKGPESVVQGRGTLQKQWQRAHYNNKNER